jgi:GNAT superfamily N-acetyltransferase
MWKGSWKNCGSSSPPFTTVVPVVSRAHFFDYMVGQCSKLERKSIEPMALHVEGGTIRGLQRFLSDVHWDEAQMRWNYHQLVAEELGEPDGVLMFDETGFVKKGKDSVGVARQYCGTLDKVENCQVGVFAGYASRQGYALVDKRLFLPEAWWIDAYAARRVRCHVPTEVTLQSKPQLAAAMLQVIAHEGLLPCKYLVADCLYGNSPDFWDAVEACVGVTACVATSAETRCWLHRPLTMDTTYTYKGEVRAKRRVVAAGERHYLAFLDGVERPVSVASMFPFPTSTIAVMQGAATLSEYRGKGVYTALMAKRLADARALGMEAAILQADRRTSAPICANLGFEEVCSIDLYVWENG